LIGDPMDQEQNEFIRIVEQRMSGQRWAASCWGCMTLWPPVMS